MSSSTGDQRVIEAQGVQSLADTFPPKENIISKAMFLIDKYLLILVIGGFLAGIGVASLSQPVIDQVDSSINVFMGVYDYIAPIAIFLILIPSLARLFGTRRLGTFGLLVIGWFAIRKVMAGIWAIIFALLVFRLPFLPEGSVSLTDGLSQTVSSLGDMATTSTYFWAMYAAIGVSLLSTRVKIVTVSLEKIMNVVEQAGSNLMPLMPIFMFAIGAYIYGLPENVKEQVGLDSQGVSVLKNLDIWGWSTSPHTSAGMIMIYVLGAELTAIACFMWQVVFLFIARGVEPRFSIIRYFSKYWVKVYPLLWATSSEALATPLNLFLTKKHAPWIRSEIRRFTVGVGSYMDINGTIINVFVLGTIVLLMLGVEISAIELLSMVPIVFLISYGVPGVPGELVLFAGPMATMLNIPEATLPIFLAVYLGLQLGLPDSFRTGSNSTDVYVGAIVVNAVYEKRYAEKENLALPEGGLAPVGEAAGS